MRTSIIVAFAASTLLPVGAGVAQDNAQREPIVLDPALIAFYERAPRRLVASMQRAVAVECVQRADDARNTKVREVRDWLCDATRDTFFRAVDVQGRGMVIGLVCESDWGIKYYSTGALEDARCVPISFGGTENAHSLELDAKND